MTRYLSPPHREAVMHLATNCRGRSRVPPFPPEAFGDVVGDQLSPLGVGTRSSLLLGHGFAIWYMGSGWFGGGAVSGSHLSDSFLASADLIVN